MRTQQVGRLVWLAAGIVRLKGCKVEQSGWTGSFGWLGSCGWAARISIEQVETGWAARSAGRRQRMTGRWIGCMQSSDWGWGLVRSECQPDRGPRPVPGAAPGWVGPSSPCPDSRVLEQVQGGWGKVRRMGWQRRAKSGGAGHPGAPGHPSNDRFDALGHPAGGASGLGWGRCPRLGPPAPSFGARTWRWLQSSEGGSANGDPACGSSLPALALPALSPLATLDL